MVITLSDLEMTLEKKEEISKIQYSQDSDITGGFLSWCPVIYCAA